MVSYLTWYLYIDYNFFLKNVAEESYSMSPLTMCEVQMLCCWILLHKNNEFLMYLVNSSEAKLITLWWLPLLTLLWTTQNYLWYYPLYCNACCTTTTIPWNQDLENKPEISPDPPLYMIKSDDKKLLRGS